MEKKNIKILAIETSCDETAAAVIEGCHPEFISGSRNKFGTTGCDPVVLSSIVSSQIDLHAKTGGVVPEVASRAHIEAIIPVITEALISAKQKISNDEFLTRLPDGQVSNQTPNSKAQNNATMKQLNNEAISFLQKEIDYIAVTAGPGLIGSLLVGYNAAKTIAFANNLPIIPVNHIEGHIYSAFAESAEKFNFPILTLTVSGGHSSLTLMKDHGHYETIGQTLDDAAGEAFDKVAKLLDLGYPGGPIVSKLASEHRNKSQISNLKSQNLSSHSMAGSINNEAMKQSNNEIIFPRPILNDGTYNFSFSGLKTAVLQKVLELKQSQLNSSHPERPKGVEGSQRFFADTQNDIILSGDIKAEICVAFEDAVVDVLTTKAMRAIEKYKPKAFVLAGGVAANEHLRNTLKLKIVNCKLKIDFLAAPRNLCGDNAAMIGLAAYFHVLKDNVSTWDKIVVDSNLEL